MGGADAYRPGSNYDPYKKDSIFGEKPVSTPAAVEKVDKKKKKKKNKKKSSSSSSSSSESEDDSDEDEKPKKFKKNKTSGGI